MSLDTSSIPTQTPAIQLSDPAIWDRLIVFQAIDLLQKRCIYTLKINRNGTFNELEKIADHTTAIPGNAGFFTHFGSPEKPNKNAYAGFNSPTAIRKPRQIAFSGSGENSDEPGIYLATRKKIFPDEHKYTIEIIANKDTFIPGGHGNFHQFDGPYILDENLIVFKGYGDNQQEGIYCWEKGNLRKIYDNKTALVPNTLQYFSHLENPSFNSQTHQLAFRGKFGEEEEGIYLGNLKGEALQKIADMNTMLPDTSIKFKGFGGPSITGMGKSKNILTFSGKGNDESSGIYLYNIENKKLSVVVNSSMPIPERENASFVFAHNPTVNTDYIVFQAAGEMVQHANNAPEFFQQGIYSYDIANCKLNKIIDDTDKIEESGSIKYIGLGPISINGDFIAARIKIRFPDADDAERLLFINTLQPEKKIFSLQ